MEACEKVARRIPNTVHILVGRITHSGLRDLFVKPIIEKEKKIRVMKWNQRARIRPLNIYEYVSVVNVDGNNAVRDSSVLFPTRVLNDDCLRPAELPKYFTELLFYLEFDYHIVVYRLFTHSHRLRFKCGMVQIDLINKCAGAISNRNILYKTEIK